MKKIIFSKVIFSLLVWGVIVPAFADNPAVNLKGDRAKALHEALNLNEETRHLAEGKLFTKTIEGLFCYRFAWEDESIRSRGSSTSYYCSLSADLDSAQISALYEVLEAPEKVRDGNGWRERSRGVAGLVFSKTWLLRPYEGPHFSVVLESAADLEEGELDREGARALFEVLDVEEELHHKAGLGTFAKKSVGGLTCSKGIFFDSCEDRVEYSCHLSAGADAEAIYQALFLGEEGVGEVGEWVIWEKVSGNFVCEKLVGFDGSTQFRCYVRKSDH
ncbi:MAG: hypothetical protein HY391_01495 [Deltaproteobacteria bacterium]|nr:hypothetical protein [Deltaproteobacteria bacterium]